MLPQPWSSGWRLRAASPLGKTNLQEFARGPTGVDSYFGATSNPWDVRRVPGGSSSGSGAAVAGGLAVAALGSDTGGSVRIPSALCGLVGIRPTYGLVSRYGAVPLGPSYDTIGPMTRSVEDAALLLASLAGHDPRDPSTRMLPAQDYAGAVDRGRSETLEGVRVGVPGDGVFSVRDAEVETLFRKALAEMETLGAEIRTAAIPFADFGRITYNAVNGPDYGRYHRETLRTRRAELSAATAESFELGLFVPGLRQSQAAAARQLFIGQAAEIFQEVDVIATPTSPIAAPLIEDCVGDCAEIWTALSNNTVAFGAIGAPAMSVPCGFTAAGLPAGMQLVGRWWEEAGLIRIAACYEQACDWRASRPQFEAAPVPDHRPTAPLASAPAVAEKTAIGEKSVSDWALSIGHPVQGGALSALTVRVDRMLASLERLDDLPLDDVEPNAYFQVPDPR